MEQDVDWLKKDGSLDIQFYYDDCIHLNNPAGKKTSKRRRNDVLPRRRKDVLDERRKDALVRRRKDVDFWS